MIENKNVVVMFPYPSGDGFHVGHAYNYLIVDSYCKWQRYNGIKGDQPFGYDAFGLPAEMYAIKNNCNPADVTFDNINKFRVQLNNMDTDFDERVITATPEYYKWTQWLFTELYKRGLAYKKKGIVNWDPIYKTVLANEQVIDGRGDRSGAIIEQIELEQWFFKITDYRERLIKNLEWIDYPEKTKKQQLHWLAKENFNDWCVSRQRKWGCKIPIEGEEDTLDTFVDSSFYYVRYCDPNNENELCAKEKYKPVDLYIGGNEHACAHLIYARFIHMFLYDIGVVTQEEPFNKVIHQGMIKLNGKKMSKSDGNNISVNDYDSDDIRFYLMFIGHYFDGGDWNDNNIVGIKRFFNRFDIWTTNENGAVKKDLNELKNIINGFVESFKFNKVVSSFMEFYNKNKGINFDKETRMELRKMLACFAPKRFN